MVSLLHYFLSWLTLVVIVSSSRGPLECGIWLAPSSLPGAGLGVYAGRNFSLGEKVVEGDVAIPVVDLEINQYGNSYSFLWDEYNWKGSSLGLDGEGVVNVAVASPGLSSTANSFLPLVNVENGDIFCDSTLLHRSKDPGAGAFSYYHNRTPRATREILQGEELFVDYGSHWFRRRQHLGAIPLHHDLDIAMEFYGSFRRLESSLRGIPDIADEVWTTFLRDHPFNESRVLGSFNFRDPEERRQLANNRSLSEIRRSQSQRSSEWLSENGICGDNLVVRQSTIRQAGRGAFASRFLPRGTMVAHLPLIHIPERDILKMNRVGTVQGLRVPDPSLGALGEQLLVNYCFGHESSTMLLCPYGPLVSSKSKLPRDFG